MRHGFCRVVILLSVATIILMGCDRRALEVAQVQLDQQHFEGQVFCLAKGLVTLTVKKVPKPSSAGNGVALLPSMGPIRGTPIALDAPGSEPPPPEQKKQEPPKAGGGVVPAPVSQGAPKADTGTTIAFNDLTFTIDAVRYVPDCAYQYAVNLKHDIFHHDDIAVAIDPTTKLLKSVNTILEDKTPEIFARIARAPAEIWGDPKAAASPISAFAVTHDVDPTDPESVAIFNRHLDNLQPPMRLYSRPLVAIPTRTGKPAQCGKDICFRTAVPYVIELHTEKGTTPYVVAQKVIVVPNKHVVGSLPITRAAFVKKEIALEFTDGMLTKTSIKNPSEVLGFIGIPIDVAKAIVSIPSAMLKFEVAQISNNNALLNQQKVNLELQRQIIDAQQALLNTQLTALAP